MFPVDDDLIGLTQEVTADANEADSVDEALEATLDRTFDAYDWEAGHLVSVDEDGELVATDRWHFADGVSLPALVADTRGRRWASGEGLPGLALETGEPVVIPDICEDPGRFPRAPRAREDGVRGAFAFPIVVEARTIGVLECFDLEAVPIGEERIDQMTAVAAHLGRAVERFRKNQAVARSHERLRTVLDSFDEAFTALDGDWRFTFLNERAAGTLPEDLDPQAAIGKRIWDVFPGLVGTEAETKLREAMESREPKRVEEIEGGEWWETRLYPFEDGLSIIQTDVTETREAQREAERQRRNLEMAEQVAGIGHWEWDIGTDEVEWSPGHYRLYGEDPDEFEPTLERYLEKVHPDARERVTEAIERTLETGEPLSHEHRAVLPDGEVLVVEVEGRLETDEDGEPVRMFGVSNDVTGNREREEELREAKQAAEAASRAKSAFLSNTSHEIRTPMNAVTGMTSLLLDTELTDEQRDYVRTIRQSGDHLLALINDILDLSKIKAGQMGIHPRPVRLREVVEESLDLIAIRAGEKGLEVAYLIEEGVPEGVRLDPGRLRQVLVNLLGNAVKFTDEGEIRVDVSQAGQARLRFEVSDTGIGIPEREQQILFEEFQQAGESPSERPEGTGLGLTICQRLVELMEGRIDVESVPGEGSTFAFTIEAEAAEIEARAPEQLSPATLRDKRVIVVDDNETNVEILEHYLAAWDAQPISFSDPEACLDWLGDDNEADLALLDQHMPKMDGIELAERIQERFGSESMPVAILSSAVKNVDAVEAADVDLAVYMTKPIKPSELYESLLRVFEARGSGSGLGLAAREERVLDPAMADRVPLTILVVEDNSVSQKVANLLLEKLGYDADLVASGGEALEALEAVSYDLVLMDVQMPDMDGYEATRRIRERFAEERQPRILALTAHAGPQAETDAADAGMDDHVAKPLSAESLVAALEKAVPLETDEDR